MRCCTRVAEARIGDLPFPTLKYIPEEVKAAGERAAVESMFEHFGPLQQKYMRLWDEFEEGTSIEGKLVQAADKLELMIQVLEYEKIGYRSLDEFLDKSLELSKFLTILPCYRRLSTFCIRGGKI